MSFDEDADALESDDDVWFDTMDKPGLVCRHSQVSCEVINASSYCITRSLAPSHVLLFTCISMSIGGLEIVRPENEAREAELQSIMASDGECRLRVGDHGVPNGTRLYSRKQTRAQSEFMLIV